MVDPDTIIAIATPSGVARKGIIRLSGPLSFSVINQRFLPDKPLAGSLRELPHYSSSPGHLEITNPKTKIPVWLYLMKAPRSYTREDVIEIHTIGSAPLLELVIEDLTRDTGIRLARPGEFTQRAFLNGRIDLAQAESVLDIIKSHNEQSLKSALNQLQGSFSDEISNIQQKLMDLVANLEAALDFSDQDIQIITQQEVGNHINNMRGQLSNLLKSGRSNQVFEHGVRAVLYGRPNVGKSSLFNCLIHDKQVIVTSIPGTTRDVLEGLLASSQNQVRLYDTAGLFNSHPSKKSSKPDELNHKIHKQTQKFLESAELYLMVVDTSRKINAQDKEILRNLDPTRTILVLNKSDLPTKESTAKIKQSIGYKTRPVIATSGRTGRGINLLKRTIFKMAQGMDRVTGDFYINTRHQLSLDSALKGLTQAGSSLERNQGYELIALDLKEALDALGEIIGKTHSEDILDRVFSRFCIGK